MKAVSVLLHFFFFNDTATTEIYTLPLHDALPISILDRESLEQSPLADLHAIASELSIDGYRRLRKPGLIDRSEEHTSELQSHLNLVCRLLLEKNSNGHACSSSPCRVTPFIAHASA